MVAKKKTTARRKSAPLESKAPRKHPTPDADEDGSAFFPELAWSAVKQLEVWHMTFNAKTKTPTFDRLGEIERWDDEGVIQKTYGGSGEGRFQVRAKGHKNQILDSITFGVRGELRQGNNAAALQTAFETAMGVVTVPGVAPMVNLMFAMFQQQTAQVRMDCERHELVIERMFTAVCSRDAAHASAGSGRNSDTFEMILKTLLEDTKAQRARVQQLLEENAGMKKEQGKAKTNINDVVQGVIATVMQEGPKAADAVKRLLKGELPAEEALELAKKATAEAAASAAQKQIEANAVSTQQPSP